MKTIIETIAIKEDGSIDIWKENGKLYCHFNQYVIDLETRKIEYRNNLLAFRGCPVLCI